MKSIITCKITMDYDKLLEIFKSQNPEAERLNIDKFHSTTVKNIKEFILDELSQDIEDGYVQVEFTDKLED